MGPDRVAGYGWWEWLLATINDICLTELIAAARDGLLKPEVL